MKRKIKPESMTEPGVIAGGGVNGGGGTETETAVWL